MLCLSDAKQHTVLLSTKESMSGFVPLLFQCSNVFCLMEWLWLSITALTCVRVRAIELGVPTFLCLCCVCGGGGACVCVCACEYACVYVCLSSHHTTLQTVSIQVEKHRRQRNGEQRTHMRKEQSPLQPPGGLSGLELPVKGWGGRMSWHSWPLPTRLHTAKKSLSNFQTISVC